MEKSEETSRLASRCEAISARSEPFFALDASAVSALDVEVVG